MLEKHELACEILQVINGCLGDRGLMLRQGTVVDETIIYAQSSTKNKEGMRDPEMGKRLTYPKKRLFSTEVVRKVEYCVSGLGSRWSSWTQNFLLQMTARSADNESLLTKRSAITFSSGNRPELHSAKPIPRLASHIST
ncbi:hypothetical protein ALQ95_02239 [Pseudomonas syringae pv. ribicola]|uniref:Uncharacterized protein n=1 Tax=Pseudomonas syringae pv. ribicola TaxID=55398 RepID=A0A3M2W6Y1_PSESI|nr:hypothetical protein ALQ95_02239 [Pseudomonas syringae pv. ribicola]